MCGIFGVYSFDKIKINEISFEEALKVMSHRGPDHSNSKLINNRLILGHLRLSIIDLSNNNNQPFELQDRYVIVYNGEIYNFIELRNELAENGFTFTTVGDTEVLLKSYIHWGEDCVNHFNGMWAFTIYDKVEEKLFCSRDRFGVKPFNYSIINSQFIFSSEIKSIVSYFPELKRPNYNVIANYCRTSIGAQIEETWFTNIKRLMPAHNLIIDKNGIKKYRYWDYPLKVNSKIKFENAVSEYRNIFYDAVKLRMRSDVPVGFTLSSGVDSSSIVCELRNKFNGNNKTYTAAYSENFSNSEKLNYKINIEIDESSIVKKLTNELGIEANICKIDYNNYVEKLSKIIWYMESGHGSPAVYPLEQILEVAKKDVTVILEGQGADELLGGYVNNVYPIYLFSLIKKMKIFEFIKEYRTFIKSYSFKATFFLLVRNSDYKNIKKMYFELSGIERLFKSKLSVYQPIKDYPNEPKKFNDLLNVHLYKSHTGGLVNLLHYGDAISMAHSLESRLPFMDYRLVEFVFQLPLNFKVKNGFGKYLHRVAMKGTVPDYILNDNIKLGFDSPLSTMFSSVEKGTPYEILLSEKCINRGLFCKEELLKIFNYQINGTKDSSRLLYRMLSVELWFRRFID